MREAGVLIDLEGNPFYWHAPAGRNCAFLPDSRDLWDLIWANRDKLLGFAHTHPGSGVPAPSHEDLTTFRAVNAALGRHFVWWIASSDTLVQVEMEKFTSDLDYILAQCPKPYMDWFEELQRLSHSQED